MDNNKKLELAGLIIMLILSVGLWVYSYHDCKAVGTKKRTKR